MSITGAIVLFVVIWFLALFVALPINVRTQGEAGGSCPAPPPPPRATPMLRRKFAWVTAVALVIWAGVCAVILWGGLSVRDIDVWGRM